VLYPAEPGGRAVLRVGDELNMDGEGHYNGGLFSLQKRFSNSYSVSGSYTVSRCINDQDPQQFLSSVFRSRATSKPIADHVPATACTSPTRPPVVNTPMFASAGTAGDCQRLAVVDDLPGILWRTDERDHRPRQRADRRAEPAARRCRRLEAG
jgi:hypothetical protein